MITFICKRLQVTTIFSILNPIRMSSQKKRKFILCRINKPLCLIVTIFFFPRLGFIRQDLTFEGTTRSPSTSNISAHES